MKTFGARQNTRAQAGGTVAGICATRHNMLAVLLVCVFAFLLAGCAAAPPRRIQPFIFRHCIVSERSGEIESCDCLKPLIVWDAKLKRKIIYCDGKVR